MENPTFKPQATVFFILLKNVVDKNGKSPVRMVVYDGKKRKRYGIGLSVEENIWDKINEPKQKSKAIKEHQDGLIEIRKRAEKVINNLELFSFTAFETEFFKDDNKDPGSEQNESLRYHFEKFLEEKRENDQIGTHISYKTTLNSIEKFRHDMQVSSVTPGFLMEYEKYLSSKGSSPTTIGIYMRQLRTIINRAIKDGVIEAKDYPFSAYQIPSARNVKQALGEEDLSKLFNYITDDSRKRKAIDFWIFSYLCNGMNFTDIAHLTKDAVKGDYLQFVRQKTKRTKKKDLTPIRVGLHPRAVKIIGEYRNTDESNPFLFNILEPGLSALTIKHRCQRFIKQVNYRMKMIAAELEINQPVNTYAARHSFSTFLKRKGVSTSYIKEALGHSSEATTESYLASFTDDVKLKYASLLTEFQVKPEVNVVEPNTPRRKRIMKS